MLELLGARPITSRLVNPTEAAPSIDETLGDSGPCCRMLRPHPFRSYRPAVLFLARHGLVVMVFGLLLIRTVLIRSVADSMQNLFGLMEQELCLAQDKPSYHAWVLKLNNWVRSEG